MNFNGFSQQDFDVFEIDGLEERMEGIKNLIRPKFNALEEHFTPFLTETTGREMFPHIAKHARRTVNPPNDTWIAFSTNKRGYKMAPHFQIGLWRTHIFVWFAMIYETKGKAEFATKLLSRVDEIKREIPPEYVWSWDHMKPTSHPHETLTHEDLAVAFERLKNVKKAEVLCGINIDRNNPIAHDGPRLAEYIENAFKTVMPLYHLSL